jgi:hypothetical protein
MKELVSIFTLAVGLAREPSAACAAGSLGC